MESDIQKNLKACYGNIAHEFSQSRKKHWPEFEYFAKFIPTGAKVLDLGCGDGRFYGYLHAQNKLIDYTGIDFCPELLKIARKSYPEASFVEEHMENISDELAYDRVMAIASFHHIPGKALRKKTLQKIYQSLKLDGILLLSVWNLWQWKYLPSFLKSLLKNIWSLFRKDPRDVLIPFGPKKMLRYYHAFLPYELRSLLRKSGFVIEEESISRENFLFVCRKTEAYPEPIPVLIPDQYGT